MLAGTARVVVAESESFLPVILTYPHFLSRASGHGAGFVQTDVAHTGLGTELVGLRRHRDIRSGSDGTKLDRHPFARAMLTAFGAVHRDATGPHVHRGGSDGARSE